MTFRNLLLLHSASSYLVCCVIYLTQLIYSGSFQSSVPWLALVLRSIWLSAWLWLIFALPCVLLSSALTAYFQPNKN